MYGVCVYVCSVREEEGKVKIPRKNYYMIKEDGERKEVRESRGSKKYHRQR